jgi:hypothetical protein
MATASVKLPRSSRVWRLGVDYVAIAANGQKTLMLTVPYALRHTVRRYLLRHPHYEVMVAVRLTMTQSGRAVQTVTRSLPIWTYVNFR